MRKSYTLLILFKLNWFLRLYLKYEWEFTLAQCILSFLPDKHYFFKKKTTSINHLHCVDQKLCDDAIIVSK